MRQIKNLIILTILITIQSCKYKCDKFPDTLMSWIPYSKGDTLNYSDGNESYKFVVVDKTKSEESSERGLWMDLECIVEASYKTNINEKLNLGYEYKCYDNSAIDLIFTNENNFIIHVGQKKTIDDNYYKTDFRDSLIIDDKIYHNVYIVEKDTLKTKQEVWRIIVAEHYGLIHFEDRTKKRIYKIKN